LSSPLMPSRRGVSRPGCRPGPVFARDCGLYEGKDRASAHRIRAMHRQMLRDPHHQSAGPTNLSATPPKSDQNRRHHRARPGDLRKSRVDGRVKPTAVRLRPKARFWMPEARGFHPNIVMPGLDPGIRPSQEADCRYVSGRWPGQARPSRGLKVVANLVVQPLFAQPDSRRLGLAMTAWEGRSFGIDRRA
jgi:hypothetical protein